MIRKTIIFLILLGVAIFFVFRTHNDKNNMADWFNWKLKHLDTQEQKEVIAYFNLINPIFNKANSTVWLPEGSSPRDVDSRRAYMIAEESMQKIKKITPPNLCINHYNLTIQILDCIKGYHNDVINSGGYTEFENKLNTNPQFRDTIRDNRIKQLSLEEKRNKEYYKILKKTGFYNKLTEEAYNLKILTKEEKEKLDELKKEKI